MFKAVLTNSSRLDPKSVGIRAYEVGSRKGIPEMGSPSERLSEKIDSLIKPLDKKHQEIISEIFRNREYLERIPYIILLLKEIEGKIDYIHSIPKESEELLTQVNSTRDKIKIQQLVILDHVQKIDSGRKLKISKTCFQSS